MRIYKRKRENDIDEGSVEKAVQALLEGMTLRKGSCFIWNRVQCLFLLH